MLSFGLIERSPAPRPGAVSGKNGTRRRYCTGFPRRCYPFRIWGSDFAGGFEPMGEETLRYAAVQ